MSNFCVSPTRLETKKWAANLKTVQVPMYHNNIRYAQGIYQSIKIQISLSDVRVILLMLYVALIICMLYTRGVCTRTSYALVCATHAVYAWPTPLACAHRYCNVFSTSLFGQISTEKINNNKIPRVISRHRS